MAMCALCLKVLLFLCPKVLESYCPNVLRSVCPEDLENEVSKLAPKLYHTVGYFSLLYVLSALPHRPPKLNLQSHKV